MMDRTPGEHDRDWQLVEPFLEFLEEYYRNEVLQAARNGDRVITIGFNDLYKYDEELAWDFVEQPETCIQHCNLALEDVDLADNDMEARLEGMWVRVSGVDYGEKIVSELRHDDITSLLGLRGQVSRTTPVKPKIELARFECQRCGTFTDPIPQPGDELQTPHECSGCKRNGPFVKDDNGTERVDHQILYLTDPPGESPGTNEHTVPVHCYRELAGSVKPGDRVRVNGVIQTKSGVIDGRANESTREEWLVEASGLDAEQVAFGDVEPERVEEIRALADEEDVQQQFIESFAPNILTGDRGDKHKLAILLQLFGGVQTDIDRGDVNVLLVGNAGTGKSHYLERAKKIAPKSIEASGKGATAAGLTATATRSDGGNWMLDAGALVLASGGLACIDEFDKMDNSARKSMHEAMENQRVPINKAGINTTLTTETSVLAACNPVGGEFDRFSPLTDNVDMGMPLLSRFDLIFSLMDMPDEEMDNRIASHQHRRGGGGVEKPIDDELLREYIAFARQNHTPSFEDEAVTDVLVEYYVEQRQQNQDDEDAPIPVTARLNDGLRRLAQASARMHLRDEITMRDAEVGTQLMDMTLGDTALEADGTVNASGSMTQSQKALKDRVVQYIREEGEVSVEDVKADVGGSADRVGHQVTKLKRQGRLYEPETGVVETA